MGQRAYEIAQDIEGVGAQERKTTTSQLHLTWQRVRVLVGAALSLGEKPADGQTETTSGPVQRGSVRHDRLHGARATRLSRRARRPSCC